jgi:large subunit ribosomal protein L4
MKAAFISLEKTTKEEMELPSEIFGIKPNTAVLYESVRMYSANHRQGNASTKARGDVRGGGAKPWRQKGTGRARAGTIRSPIWVGGGVAFGPKPREYRYSLPQKVRKLALKSALSVRAQEGGVTVLEKLVLEEAKTKRMAEIINRLEQEKGCLVVVKEEDQSLVRASRNLPRVRVMRARDLNSYDVLQFPHLVFTKDALNELVEWLNR